MRRAEKSEIPIEPRAITLLDMMLGTVGVACAAALPSGLSWFDLRADSTQAGFAFAIAVLIWGGGLGAVGWAFVVVGRHAVYRRGARPAEWLTIVLAARYVSLAITHLHAQHGSASILVAEMESGLQADLGPLGRLASTGLIFGIIAAYVGVLFRYAGFSAFLRSLLGAVLGLLWYWAPCDIWARETSMLSEQLTGTDSLLGSVLLPAFPALLAPLALAYWTAFRRVGWRRWTQPEQACVIWFLGTAALLFFHPAVRYYSGTSLFLAALLAFALLLNLIAAPLGWSVARVERARVEARQPTTRGE